MNQGRIPRGRLGCSRPDPGGFTAPRQHRCRRSGGTRTFRDYAPAWARSLGATHSRPHQRVPGTTGPDENAPHCTRLNSSLLIHPILAVIRALQEVKVISHGPPRSVLLRGSRQQQGPSGDTRRNLRTQPAGTSAHDPNLHARRRTSGGIQPSGNADFGISVIITITSSLLVCIISGCM